MTNQHPVAVIAPAVAIVTKPYPSVNATPTFPRHKQDVTTVHTGRCHCVVQKMSKRRVKGE